VKNSGGSPVGPPNKEKMDPMIYQIVGIYVYIYIELGYIAGVYS
jgi:hypothetical protein